MKRKIQISRRAEEAKPRLAMRHISHRRTLSPSAVFPIDPNVNDMGLETRWEVEAGRPAFSYLVLQTWNLSEQALSYQYCEG